MINCCLQYLHRHLQYRGVRVKLPKTLIDLIIQGVVRREHAYVTTEGGGVMVGFWGYLTLDLGTGGIFMGKVWERFFYIFFQYLGFVRLDFETFIIVQGCRVLKYYIFCT